MRISAKEFDKKFDNNEGISQYLDFENATTLGEFDKQFHQTKKINIDLPLETVSRSQTPETVKKTNKQP